MFSPLLLNVLKFLQYEIYDMILIFFLSIWVMWAVCHSQYLQLSLANIFFSLIRTATWFKKKYCVWMMFDFFFFLKPPTNKSQDLLVVITKYLDKKYICCGKQHKHPCNLCKHILFIIIKCSPIIICHAVGCNLVTSL